MNRKTPMTKADDVRETPVALVAARAAALGGDFTLDACALAPDENGHGPFNAKCRKYYCEDGLFIRNGFGVSYCLDGRDGLTGPWCGRVWCNPPFGELWRWVAKAWAEVSRDSLRGVGELELIDFLMPATRCEQDGWQRLVEPYRDGRRTLVPGWRLDTTFLPGRQHFLKDGAPILNPETGLRSSPKFGCVMLTWQKKA